jgi:merlin
MSRLCLVLVEDKQKKAGESERLKNELINARVAEKEAKEKLLSFLSLSTTITSQSPVPLPNMKLLSPERFLSVSSQSLADSTNGNHTFDNDTDTGSYDFPENNDINDISLEIEKERTEYLAKSKQVQCQLKDLRNEIEMLKISESEFDRISAEQLKHGENKYSTLKKALKQKFFFL